MIGIEPVSCRRPDGGRLSFDRDISVRSGESGEVMVGADGAGVEGDRFIKWTAETRSALGERV
jgi:hypothetical protein